MDQSGKVILWDLGNTLIKTDTFSFAKEVGLLDFLLYPVFERQNPKNVYKKALEFLDSLTIPHLEDCQAKALDRPMPALLCHWLKGSVDQFSVNRFIEVPFQEWVRKGSCSSPREARLVHKILKTMFNPQAFSQCIRVIDDGLDLLKECAGKLNHLGERRHTLIILSNWDPHSFKKMNSALPLQELFHYFDHVVISGNIGLHKPEKAIYEHILTTYNVKAQNCILIDDQQENIQGAYAAGMTGLLVQNGDYKKVRSQLTQLSVL